ncbi:MAG: hypothetical protein PHF00_06295 [Elusimicrobia bacterium]|nr:hypothetical protein [Elusimicrobiota bacterium]
MNASLRRWLVLLLALMGGVGGESLLLVRAQAERFADLLREDFKVLFFLKEEPSESQAKLIEERLLGLPETARAVYVPREDSLAALRREDPELVDSIIWVAGNPLSPAFEARLKPSGLDRFETWLAAAGGAAAWTETRYRPAQLRAMLQARLYVHFLDLVWSALLCASAAALIAALCLGAAPPSRGSWAAVAGLAAAGTAAGMILAAAAAWPARAYLPWWGHPPLLRQLALWAGVSLPAALPFLWSGD